MSGDVENRLADAEAEIAKLRVERAALLGTIAGQDAQLAKLREALGESTAIARDSFEGVLALYHGIVAALEEVKPTVEASRALVAKWEALAEGRAE